MMRKALLAVLILFCLTPFAAAAQSVQTETEPETFGAETLEDALDEQTRQALDGVSPTSGGSFGRQLLKILQDALTSSGGSIRAAVLAGGKVLAAAMLCAFAANVHDGTGLKAPALIAGAFAMTALCTRDVQSMIGLARETILKISDFTALLLPVLSASLAASGGSVSAGALLAGSSFMMSFLTKLSSGILIPLVYLYILLSAAEAAMDGGGLGKIRELAGWSVKLLTKGVCALFTAYLSLSRLLSAPADEAAVKAAQAAFSGMVPVVGSILADASESLLAGAGLIRSSAGLFGMLAVFAMAAGVFLRLGAFYLALKITGAIGADAVCKQHTALISNLSSAMGYMLAIAGSTLWMSIVSTACFLKAVRI